jgi:hypothetical protein
MLFGSPLRAAISRSGSASPDDRNAESSLRRMHDRLHEIRITAGRLASVSLTTGLASSNLYRNLRKRIMSERFASRNTGFSVRKGRGGAQVCALTRTSEPPNLGPRTSDLGPRTSDLGPRTSTLGPRPFTSPAECGCRTRALRHPTGRIADRSGRLDATYMARSQCSC